MSDQVRKVPGPLTDVRELPYGEYLVRVVHQEKRDASHGVTAQTAQYHRDNTPHVVLQLEEHWRAYVLDDAQQFRIGSVRGEAPGMFKRYRMVVSEPGQHTGISEDITRNASILYTPIED